MANLTVCILTAGKGTRMNTNAKVLNKALFPLGKKAILSHILDRFPKNTEFVIGLGFLGDQVRAYLEMAHPETKFVFHKVENFDGPGSGPGNSLLECSPHLQKPFFFVSCDTLWNAPAELPTDANWLGVCAVPSELTAQYCNVAIENGLAVGLKDKQRVDDKSHRAFTGLCFIKDHSAFWEGLRSKKLIGNEHQVSNGISALITKGQTRTLEIDWVDVGDEEKYVKACKLYESFDFSKSNEALYIVDGRVIKFFADAEITRKRVEKARLKPSAFPTIEKRDGQFYSYKLVKGSTLYQYNNQGLFRELLGFLDRELWTKVPVEAKTMDSACRDFYKDKSLARIDSYYKKYSVKDGPSTVNEVKLPSTAELLAAVPWESLFKGLPYFMHGDLQFDNILYDKDAKRFTLLDWRQDFAGHVEFGDLYYDLAKLYGGLRLNYDYIKSNLLKYEEKADGSIYFDFAQSYATSDFMRILKEFVVGKSLDFQRVETLTGLIYLNMAPLHHAPFDKLLYSLGRLTLARALGKA